MRVKKFVEQWKKKRLNKGQLRAYKENEAYSCEFDITNKCNVGCEYCYNRSRPNFEEILSKDVIFKTIDKLLEIGIKIICWEGGEPYERDEWYEIMKYANSKGIHNHVLSSGDKFADKSFMEKAFKVTGSLQIHFDTIDKEKFLEVRKVSKSFYERVIQAIENIIESGYKERLSLCLKILSSNQDTIKKTIDHAIDVWGLAPEDLLVGEYVDCNDDDKSFTPSVNKSKDIKGYHYKKMGLINEEEYKEGNYPNPCNGDRIWCQTNFAINYKGQIKSCTWLPFVFGNIMEDDLVKIYQKKKGWLLCYKLYEKVEGQCADCKYNGICGGCRANAFHFADDFLTSDPLCWLNDVSINFE